MFWLYFIILAFSAFICAFAGSALMLYWLRHRADLQDIPNERSNHSTPVPRGGGLAIVLTLAGFLIVAGAPGLLVWAMLGVVLISFADDLHGVRIDYRLVIHFGAALLCLLALEKPIFQGLLSPWADHVLTALLLVFWLNLYNFMDGIDGICASQTMCLGIGLVALAFSATGITSGFAVDGAILAACCAAFLYYNWHPAKMFMGDAGSVTLGLATGFLLLQLASLGYWESALILPAYYLVDGGYTFLKRLITWQKVWEAHSQHAYQQAVRRHNSHDTVVRWIGGCNFLLIALAVLATRENCGLPALGMAFILAALLRWQLTLLKPAPLILTPAALAADHGR